MSLDEAAMIDGASHVQIFFRIILPLITPILAVCGLLVFVGMIGEFLLAAIFLTDNNKKTLATGLYGLHRRRPLQQPRASSRPAAC